MLCFLQWFFFPENVNDMRGCKCCTGFTPLKSKVVSQNALIQCKFLLHVKFIYFLHYFFKVVKQNIRSVKLFKMRVFYKYLCRFCPLCLIMSYLDVFDLHTMIIEQYFIYWSIKFWFVYCTVHVGLFGCNSGR